MNINSNFTFQSLLVRWIIAILALGLLAIALWLPYDLNFAGYGDEWVSLAVADNGAAWIGGTLRTFLSVPYNIAHLMTPNSFAGMNIILAVMIFGRGIAIYALVRQLLPENPALALVAAGLTSVYPGDVGFYALVCISITSALFLYLIALVALVSYWKHPRWYIILIIWITLGLSIGIYEVSYPLILLSPLILIYLQSGLNRRVIRVSLLWYIIPLLYLLINVAAQLSSHNVTNYQVSIVNPDNTLRSILNGFVGVYIREFWQVWDWAVLSMPQGFSDRRTWFVLAITLFWGIALWLHTKDVVKFTNRRSYVFILLGGVVALAIGYSLFSITTFRDAYYRTLFYGLPGAAIALAIFVWLLTRLQRTPRTLLAILFIGIAVVYLARTDRLSSVLLLIIGFGFLLNVRWNYIVIGAGLVSYAGAAMMGFHLTQPFAELPAQQQKLATSIAVQAPAIKSQTLILLTGSPDQKEHYAIVRNRYDIFATMMQFVYKQYDISAQLCIPNGKPWGEYQTICRFENDAVVIDGTRWTYDRVIAFTYDPDKGAVLLKQIPSEWMSEPGAEAYNPQARIDYNAPLPYRLQTVWSDIQ